jgi:hypothetical protein
MAMTAAADWQIASDGEKTMIAAIIATAEARKMSEVLSFFPSMRNLLDKSSAAQRLDGMPV